MEQIYDVCDSNIEEIYDVTTFEAVEPTDTSKEFLLIVEESFQIVGRGTVVTGYVQHAPVHVGDAVTLIKTNGTHIAARVAGIESYKKLLNQAEAGTAVGILLPEIPKGVVSAGDVLTMAATAVAKRSVSDYYIRIYCSECGVPLTITKGARKLPNCPRCNTPIEWPEGF